MALAGPLGRKKTVTRYVYEAGKFRAECQHPGMKRILIGLFSGSGEMEHSDWLWSPLPSLRPDPKVENDISFLELIFAHKCSPAPDCTAMVARR